MYKGRSFNSGTNKPPYHMAKKTRGKCGYFGGVDLNNGTKNCLNTLTLSKVIEGSNMRSRNTLSKIVCDFCFEIK